MGFNGFQIVCFQNVFQSVFKLCVSNHFQIIYFKVFFFSKFTIGFKVFSNYVFQWFSKLQNSSKCFKLYVGNFENTLKYTI